MLMADVRNIEENYVESLRVKLNDFCDQIHIMLRSSWNFKVIHGLSPISVSDFYVLYILWNPTLVVANNNLILSSLCA